MCLVILLSFLTLCVACRGLTAVILTGQVSAEHSGLFRGGFGTQPERYNMLARARNCLATLETKWQGVVERNGALQLAFGLLFGVGSGRWRLACLVLTGVQLLGLGTSIFFLTKLRSLSAPYNKTSFLVIYITNVIYRAGFLISYVCAMNYLYKFGFVANVGMEFPCVPLAFSTSRSSQKTTASGMDASAQVCSATEEDVERADGHCQYQPSLERSRQHKSLTSPRKTRIAVNVVSVIIVFICPCILVISVLTDVWDGREPWPTSVVVPIFSSLQFTIGPIADLMFSLLFVTVADTVVEQIAKSRAKLLSPTALKKNETSTIVVSCAVAEVKILKEQMKAWLATLSPWFILHESSSALAIIGQVFLIWDTVAQTGWTDFAFSYPLLVISFALPLIYASLVTRHWDNMASDVITSDHWLPDHWQEHMYLRQFLEHSPGGFFISGFRLSGNILVSMAAVLFSALGALHQFL